MGDFNSIATLTRTLVHLVQDGLSRCGGDVARATVTTSRPDKADPNPQPRVNLFLFHAVPNPYLRNDDLPLRTANGLIRRPALALDLYYLVSFYGTEDRAEPQILMGATMSVLNAHPILGPAEIASAAKSYGEPIDDRFAVQQVQLTLHAFSVEELSRLWSTFPQVPYVLSVCYRASGGLIEADEVPAPALPTQNRGPVVQSSTLPLPTISAVAGAAGSAPVYASILTIAGGNLAGENVEIRLGGAVLRPSTVSAKALTVVAAGPGVSAGIQSLQVARDGFLSNAVSIALSPRLVSSEAVVSAGSDGTFSGVIHLTVEPALQSGEGMTLELFPAPPSGGGARQSYSFNVIQGDTTPDPAGHIAIAVSGVAGGAYLARATVDGAASLLDVDSSGIYAGPKLVIAQDRSARR